MILRCVARGSGFSVAGMNYTKTAMLILAGTLIVKLVAESAAGANIYKSGGAVPTMLLAFLVVVPIAFTADLVSRWRTRRAERLFREEGNRTPWKFPRQPEDGSRR